MVNNLQALKTRVFDICTSEPRTFHSDSAEMECVTEYISHKPSAPILLFTDEKPPQPIIQRDNLWNCIRAYPRVTVQRWTEVTDLLLEPISNMGSIQLKVEPKYYCISVLGQEERRFVLDPHDPNPSGSCSFSMGDWVRFTSSPSPHPPSPPTKKPMYRKPNTTPFPELSNDAVPFILQMNLEQPALTSHTSSVYARELYGLREMGGLGMIPDIVIPFTWDDVGLTLQRLHALQATWEARAVASVQEEDAKRAKLWLRTISFYIQVLLRHDGKTWMEIFQLHSKYT